MATVADILAELAVIEPQMKGDVISEVMKTDLIGGILQKIENLQVVDTTAAINFCTVVAASSLPRAHAAPLRSAMEAVLTKSIKTAKKAKVQQQLLTNNLAYCTASDWLKMSDPKCTPEMILSILAAREASVGIRSLDEDTVRWAVATTLQLTLLKVQAWPKYQTIFGWVHKFKEEFTSLRTPWNHTPIKTYPLDPRMLPDAVFKTAYADEEPVTKEFIGYHQLGEHVPLRSNSIRQQVSQGSSQTTFPFAQMLL